MITARSTDFLSPANQEKFGCMIKMVPTLKDGSPKNIGESLFAPPRHYRIRGKDYIIAIRDDGNVYLMNRRGEVLKNFPLNLNARPSGIIIWKRVPHGKIPHLFWFREMALESNLILTEKFKAGSLGKKYG